MRLWTLVWIDVAACVACMLGSFACCATGWPPAAAFSALLVGATMGLAAQACAALAVAGVQAARD